jgi:hypothetical protein
MEIVNNIYNNFFFKRYLRYAGVRFLMCERVGELSIGDGRVSGSQILAEPEIVRSMRERSENFRYLIVVDAGKLEKFGIPMIRMSDVYGDSAVWSRVNGTIPVDIVVPYPIDDIAKQLLTDREVMMNIFLTKSVIFVESSDLDEFIKFDHTKSQVNLEILLSDESESDDSSVGASEAEEVVDYVSGGSDLAVVTEGEDDARGFSLSIPV